MDEGDAPARNRTFVACFAITLFFCLIVTGVLCALEGTLFDSAFGRLPFLADRWNLLFYGVVCPTYVSLSVLLMSVTLRSWASLADFADAKNRPWPGVRGAYRVYSVAMVVLLACAVFTYLYVKDVLRLPSADVPVYWFMTVLADGQRVLNPVGYYYVVLNFFLLLVTLLGAACFFSLSAEVLRAGATEDPAKVGSFAELQVQLKTFTPAYLYAKALTAAYAVNFFVWSLSPLGDVRNLFITQVALAFMGVFFIAVPRQYVEMRWYKLWLASGQSFEYVETRDTKTKLAASLLDALFLSLVLGSWTLDGVLRAWFSTKTGSP